MTVNRRFSLGPGVTKAIDRKQLHHLLVFYHTTHPEARVLDHATYVDDLEHANYLNIHARFHKYMFLQGRKISPSTSLSNACNSIIQVDFDGVLYAGQVFSVVTHHQPQVEKEEILFEVSWFERLEDADTSHWDPLYVPYHAASYYLD
jgi:hypothetical protein